MSADSEPWPAKADLERWMMNTVKDPDPGACFLRQVLQMNPAYGSYMQSDKDLVKIVQLFAKRLRARFMAASGPLTPNSLYEPLCEMTWRITGHVLHAVLNVDESLDDNGLPVPKEPQGQVKMLVQTNMELSRKLNLMRRDYLRELTSHRDKQRSISDEAQEVLQDLQEHPVMFFEPLKFVLDDVTKEFIKLVVEERVKLDQKAPPVRIAPERFGRAPEKKATREKPDKALLDELAKVRSEMRKAQEDLHVSQIENKRLAASEKQARQQLEKTEELRSKAARQGSSAEEELRSLRQALQEKEASLKELEEASQSKGDKSAGELKQRAAELAEAQKKATDLSSDLSRAKEELVAAQTQMKGLQEKLQEVEAAAAAQAEAKPAPTTTGDYDRKKLGEALEAQKKLSQEKEELEKALVQEKRRKKDALDEAASAKAEAERSQAKAAEAQEALKKAEAAKAKAAAAPVPPVAKSKEEKPQEEAPVPQVEESPEVRTVTQVVTVETPVPADDSELKEKCALLEDEKVDLENKVAELNNQVEVLTQKLQEVGGDQAIMEVQELIKLSPVKKKKKKKPQRAYQRLYQDAQRRIVSMRVQAKTLEQEQESQIGAWRKTVVSEKSMKIIENLSKMHKVASKAQRRLTHAMLQFQAEDLSPENSQELTLEDSQEEMHSVWDDDDDDGETETDDGELSPLPLRLPIPKSSGPAAGHRVGGSVSASNRFLIRDDRSEHDSGAGENSAEVEALHVELARKEHQCQLLRDELASLKRMLNMADEVLDVHDKQQQLDPDAGSASIELGIMGFKAPKKAPGDQLSPPRDRPESRPSTASPHKNAAGEYIPPHARPLPKGERYDASQEPSYLQQLQQMSQKKETVSQRSESVRKFKKAVDLIRKAPAETRASLLGASDTGTVAAAVATAETASSAPAAQPSALARFRRTVTTVQRTLKDTLQESAAPGLDAPVRRPDRQLTPQRPLLRKSPSGDRMSSGPSPAVSPRPSPRLSARAALSPATAGAMAGDEALAPRRMSGNTPSSSSATPRSPKSPTGRSTMPEEAPLAATALRSTPTGPVASPAPGLKLDEPPVASIVLNELRAGPTPRSDASSTLEEAHIMRVTSGTSDEAPGPLANSGNLLSEKPFGLPVGDSRATTASSAMPIESRATTAGSGSVFVDSFPSKGPALPPLPSSPTPTPGAPGESQTASLAEPAEGRPGSSGSSPRFASQGPHDVPSPAGSVRSATQGASWAAAAATSLTGGERKASGASAIRSLLPSEASSAQVSRAQTPQLETAPGKRPGTSGGASGASGPSLSRSRPQSQGSARPGPEPSPDLSILSSFGYKPAEPRSPSKASKGSKRSVPSNASSPERSASEAGRRSPSPMSPGHAVSPRPRLGEGLQADMLQVSSIPTDKLFPANKDTANRKRTSSSASGSRSRTASQTVVSKETPPPRLMEAEARSQVSSGAASKEAPAGKQNPKLLKHSRTAPALPSGGSKTNSLPAVEVFDRRAGSAEEHPFPQRSRLRRDRFGSDEWDKAPVKPRSNHMMVTAMRSQQWMSQVGPVAA